MGFTPLKKVILTNVETKYSNTQYWQNEVYKSSAKNEFIIKRCKPVVKKIHEIINVKKNDKILDVGCGAGDFTYQLSLLSDNVLGIDHNDYIFSKNPHKNLVVSDASRMTFADDSFDIVFCANTLHHIENYEDAIKEISRVSKRYVIIYEPNPLSIFMICMALSRKEERLILKKPLTMNKLLEVYLPQCCKVVYASHLSNYVFTNALPNSILKFVPKPEFVKHHFGTDFLVIIEKKDGQI